MAELLTLGAVTLLFAKDLLKDAAKNAVKGGVTALGKSIHKQVELQRLAGHLPENHDVYRAATEACQDAALLLAFELARPLQPGLPLLPRLVQRI